MNSGAKRRAFGKGHAADLKFLTWARGADVRALRQKIADLQRQKDFPSWKRAVLTRALLRKIDLECDFPCADIREGA